jgi:branched-chain amino acid transport system ATP-binding protein
MLETRKRKPDVMIEVKSVYKQFGGVHAVENATLKIEKGSITGLIGPNGAGKTTLFNIIAGNLKPSSGQVLLDGEDVSGLPPHLLFQKGLLRTFQLAHEFSTLTVLENLMMVPNHQLGESLMSAWFSFGEVKRQEAEIRERAMEVIEFLNLTHVAQELAGNLSGGQKKLIELGRTMMVDAKVVLLDEVGAGVNRTLLSEIGDAIVRLNRERGYTFCMIEHDMDFIGKLCDPVIVMAEGTVLAEGTAEEVRNNEAVIEAYLGRGLKNKTPEQMRAMADANGEADA